MSTMARIRTQQRLLRIECARRKRERARHELQVIMAKWYDGHDLTSAEGKRAKEARRQVAEAETTLEELDAG